MKGTATGDRGIDIADERGVDPPADTIDHELCHVTQIFKKCQVRSRCNAIHEPVATADSRPLGPPRCGAKRESRPGNRSAPTAADASTNVQTAKSSPHNVFRQPNATSSDRLRSQARHAAGGPRVRAPLHDLSPETHSSPDAFYR